MTVLISQASAPATAVKITKTNTPVMASFQTSNMRSFGSWWKKLLVSYRAKKYAGLCGTSGCCDTNVASAGYGRKYSASVRSVGSSRNTRASDGGYCSSSRSSCCRSSSASIPEGVTCGASAVAGASWDGEG